MPPYIVSLPPAASSIKPRVATFTRSGKDGNEVIVPIMGTENFVGEVLGGDWQKDSDGDILSATAILSSGHIELTGKSHLAGNHDYSWIANKWQLHITDGLVLKVAFQVPSSVSASRTVGIELDLVAQYPTGSDPQNEADWLKIQFENSNGTYEYRIRKSVDGTESNVKDWTSVTNRNIVFKLVFNETKNGSTAISIDDGESGTFEDVDGSPFSLDLNFTEAYPVLCMETDDATSRTVDCDYIDVDYPASVNVPEHIKYEAADRHLGRCKVYDTNNEASEDDWTEVFSEDHVFVGDCVLQNGLIRVFLDDAVEYGLKLYWWDGAAWTQEANQIHTYLDTSAQTLSYPSFVSLKKLCSEQVSVIFTHHVSSAVTYGYYVKYMLTLQRGHYILKLEPQAVFPRQNFYLALQNSPVRRFGYAGDAETEDVGDADLTLRGKNETLTDNFGCSFDPDGNGVLAVLASNLLPSSWRDAYNGGTLIYTHIQPTLLDSTILYVCLTPFSQVASLFAEAEDETLSGGFGNYIEFTVPATKVDEDLTDFPVLLLIKDGSGINSADLTPIFDELGSESLKLSVQDSLENEKYVEVVSWDEVGEFAELWFKTDLSSSVDNVFRIYYDASHADNSDYVGVTGSAAAEQVWDSSFKGVWHMNDATTSTILDSTSNDNDGTKASANNPLEVTGNIGKAQRFSADNIDTAAVNFGEVTAITLLFYVDVTAVSGTLIEKGALDDFLIFWGGDGKVSANLWISGVQRVADASTTMVGLGYTLVTVTWSSGNPIRIYYNDTLVAESANYAGVLDNQLSTVRVGKWKNGNNPLTGDLDDLQIRLAVDSAWVGASSQTQNDSFINFDSPSVVAGSGMTQNLADDSGTSVRLMTQNDFVTYTLDPTQTYLMNGRYLLLVRAKDTNQIASDVGIQVYNSDDSTFNNEENAEVAETVTADYAIYQTVFDVSDADAGNPLSFRVKKLLADANTIYIDYFLIVPLSNGESFCQDVAHQALRSTKIQRSLVDSRFAM